MSVLLTMPLLALPPIGGVVIGKLGDQGCFFARLRPVSRDKSILSQVETVEWQADRPAVDLSLSGKEARSTLPLSLPSDAREMLPANLRAPMFRTALEHDVASWHEIQFTFNEPDDQTVLTLDD